MSANERLDSVLALFLGQCQPHFVVDPRDGAHDMTDGCTRPGLRIHGP